MGQAPSTLGLWYMTYVAAISLNHLPVDGTLIGRHPLVPWFLLGARQMRSICRSGVLSWDLALVLGALIEVNFSSL